MYLPPGSGVAPIASPMLQDMRITEQTAVTIIIGAAAIIIPEVAGARAVQVGTEVASAGRIVGGGAGLESLSPSDILRIQNAANRTQQEITVVGSRAAGTAGAISDWDYVVSSTMTNKQIRNMGQSLPNGYSGLGEGRLQDFFQSPLNTNLPYITFKPTITLKPGGPN